MDTRSIWQALSPPAEFPVLEEDISVDVAVVGGGITGVTTALQLSRAGQRVALVEAHEIGCSATGGSTGNLYATVDEHLFRIKEKWDADTARGVVESRRSAIETIGGIVREYAIDCGFGARDWHFYATTDASADARDAVDHEYEVAREAGLDASHVDRLPLPFEIDRAIRITGQAQLNPLAYVRGLARGLGNHCRIFEHTPATGIDAKAGAVTTPRGTINADAIVLATHTPKGVYMMQTAMQPAREYGLAARLKANNYPEGIFWSADTPKHSIRSYQAGGERYLMVIGLKHQTGKVQHTADCYEQLESFTRKHFGVADVAWHWSAQHYRAGDMLPYIGESPRHENVYLATGFATDGLVYGTLAASIITDEIVGRDSRWGDLYKPSRFTPGKSAKQFVKQNLAVVAELAKKVTAADAGDWLDEVHPGEGRLIKTSGKKLAVYRDEQGQATVLGATCTHLGCDVHWNDAERTWDCPCHGSRFRLDGSVIEGPAIEPLKPQKVSPFS
ncbi:MAG TPA: FAD-dependent oxidoreductase [Gammaproteobacteria bacterium]|nr:FAD-dependent oxidoreductase [Gammaproteobacteria bacterium]